MPLFEFTNAKFSRLLYNCYRKIDVNLGKKLDSAQTIS